MKIFGFGTKSAIDHEHAALYRLALKLSTKREVEYDSAFERALVGNVDDMSEQKRNFNLPLWASARKGDLDLYKTVEAQEGENQGKFGETVMHILFLFWPRDHKETPKYERMLRYLVEKHPALINKIYTKEPYVGEHVLHMAIVNNDLPAVKLLVENNADIHCSATGFFFKPYGNWYQGAFPLSFAAVGGNKQIVKYLLDKGADPFRADDVLGNNVMHMMVVYQKPEMFDLILEYADEADKKRSPLVENWAINRGHSKKHHVHATGDVELNKIKDEDFKPTVALHLLRSVNNFQRTALTLAAELGRVEMFLHIMNKEKELMWRYGTVQASAYPLDELDTYPIPERLGRPGALELIVYLSGTQDEDMERAKMLDVTPINQLVQQKWEEFANYWYYGWLLIYLCYLIIFTLVVCEVPQFSETKYSFEVCQIIVLLGAILFIVLESIDIYRMGTKYFNEKGSRFFFALIWLYSILIIIVTILRYGWRAPPGAGELRNSCGQFCTAERILLALAALFAWNYLMFFLRGSKAVGILVVMLREMLFGDIARWVVIYVIVMFSFVASFTNLYLLPINSAYWDYDTTPNFDSFSAGVESLYKSLFGDFSSLGTYDGNWSKGMAIALFVGYSILSNILLLNMLIAMLNFTFSKIQDRARLQWKLEWVSIILLIERRLPFFVRERFRSGKPGKNLGAKRPETYYIILEESVDAPGERNESPLDEELQMEEPPLPSAEKKED